MSDETKEFTCQCCGHVEFYPGEDEAHQAGWDFPPYVGPTVCSLCPAYYVIMKLERTHKEMHERWAQWGRPVAFSLEECVSELDQVSVEKLMNLKQKLGEDSEALTLKRLLSHDLLAKRTQISKPLRDLSQWVEAPEEPSIWVL